MKSGLNETDAYDLERYYISKYGRIDLGTGSLTNLTPGGPGGPISPNIVKSYHSREEYKEKLSRITQNYWDNASEEEREKRRKAGRDAYVKDPLLKAKRSTSMSRIQKNKTKEEKEATASKISDARKRLIESGWVHPSKGKPNKKCLGTKFYNNGIVQGMYKPGEEPEGWVKGRIK